MLFKEDVCGYCSLDEAIDKEVEKDLLRAVKFLMKQAVKDVETLNAFSDDCWMETCD